VSHTSSRNDPVAEAVGLNGRAASAALLVNRVREVTAALEAAGLRESVLGAARRLTLQRLGPQPVNRPTKDKSITNAPSTIATVALP
jgi:hypothetical protein